MTAEIVLLYNSVMSTITISKREYKDLIDKKIRYEKLRAVVEEDIFASPPTKNATEVTEAFKATGKYSRKFLTGLAKGLKRSSYFRV